MAEGRRKGRLPIEAALAAFRRYRPCISVAAGGFLDATGNAGPFRWPPADIEGTILIAVGARCGPDADPSVAIPPGDRLYGACSRQTGLSIAMDAVHRVPGEASEPSVMRKRR